MLLEWRFYVRHNVVNPQIPGLERSDAEWSTNIYFEIFESHPISFILLQKKNWKEEIIMYYLNKKCFSRFSLNNPLWVIFSCGNWFDHLMILEMFSVFFGNSYKNFFIDLIWHPWFLSWSGWFDRKCVTIEIFIFKANKNLEWYTSRLYDWIRSGIE